MRKWIFDNKGLICYMAVLFITLIGLGGLGVESFPEQFIGMCGMWGCYLIGWNEGRGYL